MGNIIDCHLHVLNKQDFEMYKKTACANKFINIRGINIEEMLKPFKFEDFIDLENMYFLDSINLNNVDDELIRIANDLKKYPRILGIKIYLGYQRFYANDKKIMRVAKFADENGLSVTFHCGEIFNEEGISEFSPYSNAKHVEFLAKKFPDVNFIASHLNWPQFEELFLLINNYGNVYSCFSGCNDGETENDRIKQNLLISKTLNEYMLKYPAIKKKIMYGTDFFASSDEYNDVTGYYEILNLLKLDKNEKKDILCNNAIKAYNKKIL